MLIKISAIGVAVLVVTFFTINSLFFTKISLWEIPSLLNASRAKEFCSCYFMLKKGKEYCWQRVQHGYPVMGYMIDETNRAVRFDLLWNSRLAMVRDEKFGCELK